MYFPSARHEPEHKRYKEAEKAGFCKIELIVGYTLHPPLGKSNELFLWGIFLTPKMYTLYYSASLCIVWLNYRLYSRWTWELVAEKVVLFYLYLFERKRRAFANPMYSMAGPGQADTGGSAVAKSCNCKWKQDSVRHAGLKHKYLSQRDKHVP